MATDDDPAEWKLHLTEPAADEHPSSTLVKLGGCPMLIPSKPPAPPFWLAVEYGDVAEVAAQLDAGEPVDQPGGPYGSTALGWAAFSGNLELARLCLGFGAKPNAKARKGSTPLHMATWNGDHEEVVGVLLEAQADPQLTNAAGLTPLAQARWFHELDLKSAVDTRYAMAAWREQWGLPAAGRAKVIAKLEAATASEQGGEAAAAGDDGDDGEPVGRAGPLTTGTALEEAAGELEEAAPEEAALEEAAPSVKAEESEGRAALSGESKVDDMDEEVELVAEV